MSNLHHCEARWKLFKELLKGKICNARNYRMIFIMMCTLAYGLSSRFDFLTTWLVNEMLSSSQIFIVPIQAPRGSEQTSAGRLSYQ